MPTEFEAIWSLHIAFPIIAAKNGVQNYRDKLIYIDQDFYTHIHGQYVAGSRTGVLLHEIAQLGYGDQLFLGGVSLAFLRRELRDDQGGSASVRRQRLALRRVLQQALRAGRQVCISGDMFPVIGKDD